jgi:hypothetical protein
MKTFKSLLLAGVLALGLCCGTQNAQAQYSGQVAIAVPATVPALTQTNIFAWVDAVDSEQVALQLCGKGGSGSAVNTVCGWSLDRNTNHLYNVFTLGITPTGTTNTTIGTNLTAGAQGYLCIMYQTNTHSTVTWTNENGQLFYSFKKFRP